MIREHKICIRLNDSEQFMLGVICRARSLSPSEAVRDLLRDEWKKMIENGEVLVKRFEHGEVQSTEE